MSAEPSAIPLDHPAALPSDASTSKEGGGGVEAHQPSSSSSSSSATIVKSSLPFPFNHPTDLHLFFDPTSVRAIGVSEKLQTIWQRFDKPSPTTLNLEEATHLVLEEATELNEELREAGVGAHQLVSLQWIINSTFSRKPLDEKDFSIVSVAAVLENDMREEGEKEGEDEPMEQEEEGGASSSLPIVVRTSRIGSWGEDEDEMLARFLASRPAPYRQSDFAEHVRKHRGRTDEACARRYRKLRAWFDQRIDEIKSPLFNGRDYVEPDSASQESDTSQPATSPANTSRRYAGYGSEDDEDFDESSEEESRPSAPTYSPTEKNDLISCLSSNPSSLSAAFRSFSKLHPNRSAGSASTQYYHHKSSYDAALARNEQGSDEGLDDADSVHAEPRRRHTVSKGGGWSTNETEDLVRLLALRKGSKAEAFRAMVKKHPRRSVIAVSSRYEGHRTFFDEAIEKFQRKAAKKTVVQDQDDDSLEEEDRSRTISNNPLTPPGRTNTFSTTSDGRSREEDGLGRASSSVEAGSSKQTRVEHASNPSLAQEDYSEEDEGPVRRHTQRTRPSNAAKQPHLPLPQQDRTSSNGFSTIASSSHSAADLKRPSSFVEPGSSSKRSRVASNPPPAGVPSSSHHSHHQQHASSSFRSHPVPLPSAPSPSSSSSSSRDDQPLEPPSFFELGAKPSSCSSTDEWCYVCGAYGRGQFELLQLVTRNDGGGGRAKSIDSRLGCDACARVYRRRLEAKEVAGLDVTERIEYASECVLKEGLEIRREAVEG